MGSGEQFLFAICIGPFLICVGKDLDLGWGWFCIRGFAIRGKGLHICIDMYMHTHTHTHELFPKPPGVGGSEYNTHACMRRGLTKWAN